MCSLKKDKEGSKFEIRFYSGYKGEEVPKAVIIGNREFNIDEIISRKRALDQESGEILEVYKCKMEGEIVEIKVFESGKWAISFSRKT